MLPQSLSGTYLQYKDHTSIFATWLANHAKECGYRLQPIASTSKPSASTVTNNAPRLKGRARKEAKAAAEKIAQEEEPLYDADHIVPVREILLQAQAIANKRPLVKMPLAIQLVLERAIQARRRCTSWYEINGNEDPETLQSNASHTFFTSTLEQALETLRPCFEKPTSRPQNNSAPPPRQPAVGQSSVDPASDCSNRFGMLNVEDAGDDYELDIMATDDLVAAPKSKTTGKKSKREIYEIEREPDSELAFIVFCFFEDLHRIEDMILEIWDKVSSGKISRVAASLTTNAAIQLVQKAEADVYSICPQFQGRESYPLLINIIHSRIRPGHRGDSEFIYTSTYLLLCKYKVLVDRESLTTPVTLGSMDRVCRGILRESTNPNSKYEDLGTAAWIEYEMSLSRNDDLLSKILLNFEIDHFRDIKAELQKKQPEKENLDKPTPFEDEVTKALRLVPRRGDIGVWVVFAAHMLCKIPSLRDTGVDPYEELLRRAVAADKSLGVEWSGRVGLIEVTNLKELSVYWGGQEEGIQSSVRLSDSINSRIYMNPSIYYKNNWQRVHMLPTPEHLGKAPQICIPEDPAYAVRQNTIYCDLEMLRINIDMEDIGIQNANKQGSFLAVAHLYNAVDKFGLLGNQRWQKMDDAIAIHIKQLFNGSTPSTEQAIIQRFGLRCLGLKADTFARNHRGYLPHYRTLWKRQDNALQCSDLSKILSRYLEGEDSAEQLLRNINSRIPRDKKRRRPMNNIELLQQLCSHVSEFMPRLETEVMLLVRDCSELLLRIRQAVSIEICRDPDAAGRPPGYREDKPITDHSWNLPTVMSILVGPIDHANLKIVAEIIKKFADEINGRKEPEPFDVLAYTRFEKEWEISEKMREHERHFMTFMHDTSKIESNRSIEKECYESRDINFQP